MGDTSQDGAGTAKNKTISSSSRLSKELRELIPAGIAVVIGFLVIPPPLLFPKFAALSAFVVAPAISLFAFVRACQLAGKRGNYVAFDYLESLGPLRFFIAIGFFGLYVCGYLLLWFIVQVRCVFEKPRKFLPWLGLQVYGIIVGIVAIVMGFVGEAWGPNRIPRPEPFPPFAQANPGQQNPPNTPPQTADSRGNPGDRQATPDKDRQPPEKKKVVTGDAALDETLANLETTGAPQWFAADRLAGMAANQHRPVVARELAKALKRAPIANRSPIINALGVWGTPEEIPVLIDFLNDPDINTRNQVLQALGRLPDERAVKPVMRCFLEQQTRFQGEHALIALGPLAEGEVMELLNHPDRFMRRNACQMLGKIGTKTCVPALEAACKDPVMQGPAQRALREIKTRSGK